MDEDKTKPAGKDSGVELPEEGFIALLNSKLGGPKELAIKGFREISKLVSPVTEAISQIHKSSIESDQATHQQLLDIEKLVAETYSEQLRLEKLTPEERADINQKLSDRLDRIHEKDTERKNFNKELLKLGAQGVMFALALVVVMSKHGKK